MNVNKYIWLQRWRLELGVGRPKILPAWPQGADRQEFLAKKINLPNYLANQYDLTTWLLPLY